VADEAGHIVARASLGARRTISLQSLSRQGATLLGRITSIDGDQVHFGNDLGDNIRFADEASAAQKRFIDEYILRSALEVPAAEPDPAEAVAPRLPEPSIRALDLRARYQRGDLVHRL